MAFARKKQIESKMERKMNLFKKASPLVVASLMATASAFGQSNNCTPCKPKCPEDTKPLQLVAGYNAPSRIDVRGCWDVYASGSFTYWQPSMSNTELGVVARSTDTETESGVINENHILNQDFNYKPGFKVNLGMNFDWDNWDSAVEYAWFRGSDTTTSTNSEKADFYPIDLGVYNSENPLEVAFNSASQNWKLHMDLLDWNLGRSYYVGTKLTFRPSIGARAAWIRQSLNRTLKTDTLSSVLNKGSHSWGVGPRAAINTNWNLGEGFRIFGNSAADILFTQYTKLKSFSSYADSTETVFKGVEQKDVNTLRTHMDVELGLGWGSYFDCNNWHVDVTAGYGFQVFFDQNMFRNFNEGHFAQNLPNGNLYVHGLTATIRLDF